MLLLALGTLAGVKIKLLLKLTQVDLGMSESDPLPGKGTLGNMVQPKKRHSRKAAGVMMLQGIRITATVRFVQYLGTAAIDIAHYPLTSQPVGIA